MQIKQINRLHPVFAAATACALSLSLAACDQKQSGAQTGSNPDNAADQAVTKLEQAGDSMKKSAGKVAAAAEDKANEAADAISKKTVSAGDALGDAAVTAKVKSALVADRGINALEIEVSTTNGIVTLHGTASSQADSDEAAHIASEVGGVKSVRNELVVVARS